MGPALEVACLFLALAILVGVLWGLVAWARGTRDSDVALERERGARWEALSVERGELLDEAKRLLDEAASDGEEVVAGHAKLVDAVRRAPAGSRLDAAERVLRERATASRARREAAAAEALAGRAAGGPVVAGAVGGHGAVTGGA